MEILIGYRNKFVVNDMADDLAIAWLRIAAGYIFGRCALPDCITLWTITAIIIHNSINRSWNCSDIGWYWHKNPSFI